jgi:hypothetical protein
MVWYISPSGFREHREIDFQLKDIYRIIWSISFGYQEGTGFSTFLGQRRGKTLLIHMDTNLVFFAISDFVRKIAAYHRLLGNSFTKKQKSLTAEQ